MYCVRGYKCFYSLIAYLWKLAGSIKLGRINTNNPHSTDPAQFKPILIGKNLTLPRIFWYVEPGRLYKKFHKFVNS